MTAVAALIACAALAAYLALATPRLRALVIALGAVALVALAAALVGRTRLLGGALLALGGAVATLDLVRGSSAVLLVAGAAILITLGELAALSMSLRSVELIERDLLARRIVGLAAIACGGVAVAALVWLATRIAVRGGLSAGAIAVLASVLVLALASALARAHGRDRPSE